MPKFAAAADAARRLSASSRSDRRTPRTPPPRTLRLRRQTHAGTAYARRIRRRRAAAPSAAFGRRATRPICSSRSVAWPASSTRWVLLPRKRERTGFGGGRLPLTKVVLEAMEEIDTKRIDPSQEKREIGWQKAANWDTPVPYHEIKPCAKSALAAESVIVDSAEESNTGRGMHAGT